MDIDLNRANEAYRQLSSEARIEKLFQQHAASDILVTSSFGSTSPILLHMINKVIPGHPVHFLDTSFHFKETLHYKEQLTKQLGLNVISVSAQSNKNKFTRENKTWAYNQDLCCFINKVEPLNELKSHFKIWISGLMAYQNANRQNIQIFEKRNELLKFHPLIDMTSEESGLYQLIHGLPAHPLRGKGYDSIGCLHCTRKGSGRSGRWNNIPKTECGIHL